jgi:tetratricopeptide (TPR) repeat protein
MPAQAPAARAPEATSCRSCGKALLDPFDQALGICDDCRQRSQNQAASPAPAQAPMPGPAAAAAPRSVEVIDLPPMSEPAVKVASDAPPAPELPRESRSGVYRPYVAPPMPTSAARPKRVRPGLLVAMGVLVLLVGGGMAAFFFVPSVQALVSGETPTPKEPVAAALPPAVEAILPRWQLLFVDLSGDAVEHLKEGRALLAKDQRLSYEEAQEAFQRALLLNPRSDAAIAGYVQALSLGYGTSLQDETFEEALGLIQAAESRAGRRSDVLVAHANLLLTRPGQPEYVAQARQLADEALARAGAEDDAAQKAEAHLVLGRLLLGSSRELANQHFESALALAPDLKRVHYYRALANEAAGDYSQALAGLEKRIALDPEHWESLATMGRIFLEVGQPERARQLYETRLKSSPGDFQAQLALAVLRYQTEGQVAQGITALRTLLRSREKYEPPQVAEVLLHLSAAERVAGNLDAAGDSAREALKLVKEMPAAHFQLFFVALEKKDAAVAAGHLANVRGKLEDPVLEKLLEGRLRLLEGRYAEAQERFLETARQDPRRVDAVLMAGVAAALDKRRDDAFRVLAPMLQADPLRPPPRPVSTPFYMRVGELMRGFEGTLLGLASGSDDVLPRLYEALLRYSTGDLVSADRFFKSVNDVDETNAHAFSYRALIAVERKQLPAARPLAAKAVAAAGRRVAIAHLAQGVVLMQARQEEQAKRALREALTIAPSLLSAEVKLAEIEALEDPASARARLIKVVGLDPSFLHAKRILFILDR